MRRNTMRYLAVGSLLLLSVAGCLVRSYELNTIFDDKGLPISGEPITWMLALLSAVVVIACALLSWALPRGHGEQMSFSSELPPCILALLGGACILLSGALLLFEQLRGGGFGYRTALGFLQLMAGLSMMAAAVRRRQGARPMPALHAVICLWLVLTLLLNFKSWSMDPTILDYCFRLFALICGMCATYHIGALGYVKGGRRVTAFWCLAGCYFCLVSMRGEPLTWGLMSIGVFLWLLVNGWQLFAPVAQHEN